MGELMNENACANAQMLSRTAIDKATEANVLWGTDDERARQAIGVAEIAVGVWGECSFHDVGCALPEGEECPIAGLLDEISEYGTSEGDDSI